LLATCSLLAKHTFSVHFLSLRPELGSSWGGVGGDQKKRTRHHSRDDHDLKGLEFASSSSINTREQHEHLRAIVCNHTMIASPRPRNTDTQEGGLSSPRQIDATHTTLPVCGEQKTIHTQVSKEHMGAFPSGVLVDGKPVNVASLVCAPEAQSKPAPEGRAVNWLVYIYLHGGAS
jgi:hypothetical protein